MSPLPSGSLPAHALSRRGLLQAGAGLGLGLLLPPGAHAATPPPEVAQALPQARRVGQGRLRYFGLHIYDAELWAGAGLGGSTAQDYAREPLALVLTYARSLVGRKIAERSLEEMRRIGPIRAEQGSAWLAYMNEAFPDVRDGERLTGLQQPGEGAHFFFNGTPRPSLRDPEFARLFFGIWLAPATSQPRLRESLLGLVAP